jgi:nucleotide-binding universal stress UspA family protein
VLLASEGREFSPASIALAAALAGGAGGTVHVLAVARVHGVSFGLPNPGLLPTRAEWDAQRDAVQSAVTKLRRRGLRAEGEVFGTRKATARILGAADQLGCTAIVMGADAARSRLIGDMLWSQEPQRVKRRAKVPVHLAVDDPPAAGR